MYRLLYFFLLLIHLPGCGQDSTLRQPTVSAHQYPVGNRRLQVTVSRYDSAAFPVFVHLHHNEQTANKAAHYLLQRTGGVFVSIQNKKERLITFKRKGQKFVFDPNRMFTSYGIAQSLKLNATFDSSAAQEIDSFAHFFLKLIPETPVLIALHNNTNENYSIYTYQTDSSTTGDAAALHINKDMDADDFIFTTDSLLFAAIKEKNLNVVLQNNEAVTDDGSLSVYWARQGKRYVNIETEHGHKQQQVELICAVLEALTKLYPTER